MQNVISRLKNITPISIADCEIAGCSDFFQGSKLHKFQKPEIRNFLSFMLTVHLNDLRFFAHHGVFDGEPVAGGEFEVQLDVCYDEKKISFDDLNNVLNYVELYHIVKKRMAMPTPLIEEIAESIIRKIRHEYSFVKEISISIFKLQPPIEHFQGKVGVTLQKKFDD